MKSKTLDSLIQSQEIVQMKVFSKKDEVIRGKLLTYDDVGYTFLTPRDVVHFVPHAIAGPMTYDYDATQEIEPNIETSPYPTFNQATGCMEKDGIPLRNTRNQPISFKGLQASLMLAVGEAGTDGLSRTEADSLTGSTRNTQVRMLRINQKLEPTGLRIERTGDVYRMANVEYV